MDNLTPAQLWTFVLAAASAIVLLSNAAEKIGKAIAAAKKPNKEQNDRLDKIEGRLDNIDRKLEADKKRLEDADEIRQVELRALLALLDHGIDGNNITQMQAAKNGLLEHLTHTK